MSRSPLRVAIVGAGVSGLVSARVLTAVGFAVTVFEKTADVGGVWSAERAYPGIATQDDRRSYAFSDHPMPCDVAEHPAGADVRAYLERYADEHGVRPHLRLATEVVRARLVDEHVWEVESRGSDGDRVERFDWLVAANGVFSTPHVPAWPGRAEFEAAGGRVVVPGALGDGGVLDGRRTVVVGWGKTACDVAVAAARRAASTAVVVRTLTWKYPKRIGLAGLTFRHLVLTRAGERILATRYRSTSGRLLLRRIPERLPRVLVGGLLARAIDRSIGLTGLGLRPTSEVRTSNSLVTDGFFEAVARGRIDVLRERSVAGLGRDADGPFAELTDGSRLPAEVLIAATGFQQGVDFLAEEIAERGATDDGALLLHRRILAVDVPRLAFVGWAHSYRSPLTSEIAATWLAAVLRGHVSLPAVETRRRRAARFRLAPGTGAGARTADLPSVTFRDLDQLLDEVGAPLPALVRLRQIWRPLDPSDYTAGLAQSLGRLAQPTAGPPAEVVPDIGATALS